MAEAGRRLSPPPAAQQKGGCPQGTQSCTPHPSLLCQSITQSSLKPQSRGRRREVMKEELRRAIPQPAGARAPHLPRELLPHCIPTGYVQKPALTCVQRLEPEALGLQLCLPDTGFSYKCSVEVCKAASSVCPQMDTAPEHSSMSWRSVSCPCLA